MKASATARFCSDSGRWCPSVRGPSARRGATSAARRCSGWPRCSRRGADAVEPVGHDEQTRVRRRRLAVSQRSALLASAAWARSTPTTDSPNARAERAEPGGGTINMPVATTRTTTRWSGTTLMRARAASSMSRASPARGLSRVSAARPGAAEATSMPASGPPFDNCPRTRVSAVRADREQRGQQRRSQDLHGGGAHSTVVARTPAGRAAVRSDQENGVTRTGDPSSPGRCRADRC